MLIVLSPAKTLDYTSPIVDVEPTRPEFTSDARRLVGQLRELSPPEVASLMSLSDSLATLNVARYAAFRARPRPQDARCAVLAFDGDVYDGLQAREMDTDALGFAQRHLRILSGLYGVLRPLDALQPYRLEMGTRLATEHGRDLYAYWGRKPALALRRALRESGGDTLVNLASEEYFRAVDETALKASIVHPVEGDLVRGQAGARRDDAFRDRCASDGSAGAERLQCRRLALRALRLGRTDLGVQTRATLRHGAPTAGRRSPCPLTRG